MHSLDVIIRRNQQAAMRELEDVARVFPADWLAVVEGGWLAIEGSVLARSRVGWARACHHDPRHRAHARDDYWCAAMVVNRN
jgi:hypothetical protein